MDARGELTWVVGRVQGIAYLVEEDGVAIGDTMLQAVQRVLNQGKAVVIIRSQYTTDALRQKWEAEFYSPIVYKDGRVGKRRKHPAPQIERDWIAWVAQERRDERARKKAHKEEVMSPSQRHPALASMYAEAAEESW